MNLYLTSTPGRRREAYVHRDELLALGHAVTMSPVPVDPITPGALDDVPSDLQRRVTTDVQAAINHADVVVAFTSTHARFSLDVEVGLAIGAGVSVALIGPRPTVMYLHPDVQRFLTWDRYMTHLVEQRASRVKLA